jgi:predicted heme/steroid binding protein
MIDPVIFDQAYHAVQSSPKWQTGFHDPITGGEDLTDRFLASVAHMQFGVG